MTLLFLLNLGFAWNTVEVVLLDLRDATTAQLTPDRITAQLTAERTTEAL
jgi:hypothetical protein